MGNEDGIEVQLAYLLVQSFSLRQFTAQSLISTAFKFVNVLGMEMEMLLQLTNLRPNSYVLPHFQHHILSNTRECVENEDGNTAFPHRSAPKFTTFLLFFQHSLLSRLPSLFVNAFGMKCNDGSPQGVFMLYYINSDFPPPNTFFPQQHQISSFFIYIYHTWFPHCYIFHKLRLC